MVVIIICREFAVSGLRIINSSQGVVIPASSLGKYKMVAMVTSIILLILNYKIFFINFHFLGMVGLWIALIFSIISGADYFIKFFSFIDFES